MTPRLSTFLLVAILLPTAAWQSSEAANIGLDTAAATAYDSGWLNGTDGSISGDAFIPWGLSTAGTDTDNTAGHLIGDSTQLDGGNGADINTTGESFEMWGEGTASANAFRTFNGGDLGVGQTFSIDIAVNFRNGNKGINLRDDNTEIFNFNIGGDDYVVNNAATGNGSIGDTYSADTAFNLSFTQTSVGGGDWSITRSGGVNDVDSGTYLGSPDNFQLYVAGTDQTSVPNGNPADRLYANSPQIIPEPAAGLLLTLALLFLKARRRRD
ncbi:MAG: PEP-CTERM sorting domain-containing protein [Verrucomicrobiota bacterium]